eukprot:gene7096-5030_t
MVLCSDANVTHLFFIFFSLVDSHRLDNIAETFYFFFVRTSWMYQEDYNSEGSVDEQYFHSYEDLGVHELMLRDEPRMNFYRSALQGDIMNNAIVVDIGAGTGVLSCWAASAGAQHVFALEASSLGKLLPSVAADNNLEAKITVLHMSVEKLINEGAESFISTHKFLKNSSGINVLVSEWMGFYLLHEGMLQSVLQARDFFEEVNRLLGVNTTIELIPSHGTIHAAPISLTPLKEEAVLPWKNVKGLDLSRLGLVAFEEKLESSAPLIQQLPHRCLLHEGLIFWEAAFQKLSMEEVEHISSTKTFELGASECFREKLVKSENCSVSVDGFALWFTVSFKEHTLSTGPESPPTHWMQTTSLFPKHIRDEECVSFSPGEETLTLNKLIGNNKKFKMTNKDARVRHKESIS